MLYVPFASRHPNACSLSTYSNIRVGWSQVVFFGQLSWTGMYFSDNPQGCTVLHVALKDHKKNRAMLWKWLTLSQVQKVKIMMIWITSQKHLHTPKTQKNNLNQKEHAMMWIMASKHFDFRAQTHLDQYTCTWTNHVHFISLCVYMCLYKNII